MADFIKLTEQNQETDNFNKANGEFYWSILKYMYLTFVMTNTKYHKQGDKGIMVYLPIDQRKESCRQINKGIGSQWFNIILQHLLKYKEITPITHNWLF